MVCTLLPTGTFLLVGVSEHRKGVWLPGNFLLKGFSQQKLVLQLELNLSDEQRCRKSVTMFYVAETHIAHSGALGIFALNPRC